MNTMYFFSNKFSITYIKKSLGPPRTRVDAVDRLWAVPKALAVRKL